LNPMAPSVSEFVMTARKREVHDFDVLFMLRAKHQSGLAAPSSLDVKPFACIVRCTLF
jgi:hypothetical protein